MIYEHKRKPRKAYKNKLELSCINFPVVIKQKANLGKHQNNMTNLNMSVFE